MTVGLAEYVYRSERDKKALEVAINRGDVKFEDVEGLFKALMENAQAEIDKPLVLLSGDHSV